MTSSVPTRRAALKLPSRRKHVAMAGAVFFTALLLPLLLTTMFGDPADARAGGTVAVLQLPPPAVVSPLDNEDLETPDLLAGDVPEDTNPTVALAAAAVRDALGNPVQTTPQPKRIDLSNAPSGALAPAPISGLIREGTFGPVPQRNGAQTALKAYKRPAKIKTGRKPVSLVIGGLGIDRRLTQSVLDSMPPDVTLSFAAHAVGLQDWVDAARADGHEVLIELPLESDDFNPAEPGADRAMRLEATEEDRARNLDWLLSRAQGYFGVTNFNGDAFLRRTDVSAPFVDALSKSGLGFITDGAFDTPSLPALARSVDLPLKIGNGLIDPDPIPEIIRARLGDLSAKAADGSHPVGIGFAFAETLSEAESWIASLEAQNLQLVPASAALR